MFSYRDDIQGTHCLNGANFCVVYCIQDRLGGAYLGAAERRRVLLYRSNSMWSGMFNGTNGPTATSSSIGFCRPAFQSGPGFVGVPTRSRVPGFTLNKIMITISVCLVNPYIIIEKDRSDIGHRFTFKGVPVLARTEM